MVPSWVILIICCNEETTSLFETSILSLVASQHDIKLLRALDSTGSMTRLGDLLDLGNFSKPVAKISSHKSPTFLGNF